MNNALDAVPAAGSVEAEAVVQPVESVVGALPDADSGVVVEC